MKTGLPPLRDDLGLHPGPEAADGTPSWTIHDPARNRYFRIGRAGFELLARWQTGSAADVLARVQAETGLALEPADIEWMVGFLDSNHLLRRDGAQGVTRLDQSAQAAQSAGWRARLLHGYLFFRIPLVRPDRFLAATLPLVRPFYGRGFLVALAVVWVVGLLLALRQWDVFLATLPHLFTWQGAALFGGALALAKLVHELGHAWTAKRYGCRVPSMGVAFLVMFPVLYTDTSDTWKLVSRRQRLAVAAAGVAVEAMLGGLALVAWTFLPDGAMRSAAFSLATVGIIGTLAVNLSPFLRFDGYYLLSDALGVENLQDRGFALARWQLRRWVLGVAEPAPEHFSRRLRIALLVYAYATWVYRLVLFLSIALLVYHFFFKLLGIFLFAVEIAWFIARPLWSEAKEWWVRRDEIDRLRLRLSAVSGGLVVLALLVPWRGSVDLPAVAEAGDYAAIYPPLPARIVSVEVSRGDIVAVGDVLAVLEIPELDGHLAQVDIRILRQRALLSREAASDEARQYIHVLRRQLAALEGERAGLLDEMERLVVRSPVAGEVVGMLPILRPGLWVDSQTVLAHVAQRHRPKITAFLAEENLSRLRPGAAARFIPDDPSLQSWPCAVTDVADIAVAELDVPMLASAFGGSVAVREDGEGRLVPTRGQYRVEMAFTGPPPSLEKVTRGIVVAEGDRRSVLGRAIDVVAAILIRESGF